MLPGRKETEQFVWARPGEMGSRRAPGWPSDDRSAVRSVPMTVMGVTEQSEISGIGAAALRIRHDMVYLDQMS